jgi:hypothetical protein
MFTTLASAALKPLNPVAGAEPQEALAVLVPEAFRNHPDLMKEYPEVCEGYERLALGLEC